MTAPAGSLAARYLQLQNEMNRLHDGATLREAAVHLLDLLPGGPVALFATSDQGAGLAAACSALRDAPTAWQRIHLTYAPAAPAGHKLFIVESVDAGVAWRHALARLYPAAEILIVAPQRAAALAA